MLSDEAPSQSKQKLDLRNEGNRPLEVIVEMVPNRYLLQPKEKLTLIAEAKDAPRNEGYTLNFYDDSVQIYAAWDGEPVAFINGKEAESDWSTPSPVA